MNFEVAWPRNFDLSDTLYWPRAKPEANIESRTGQIPRSSNRKMRIIKAFYARQFVI